MLRASDIWILRLYWPWDATKTWHTQCGSAYHFWRKARHSHSESAVCVLEETCLEGVAQLGGFNQIHAAGKMGGT